jgi:hypothetical protein
MAFRVRASRPISSSPAGCGTRWSSAWVLISATRTRIASTGRSDRPTSSQELTTPSTSTSGQAISSTRRRVAISSSVRPSPVAAITVTRSPAAVHLGTVSTR